MNVSISRQFNLAAESSLPRGVRRGRSLRLPELVNRALRNDDDDNPVDDARISETNAKRAIGDEPEVSRLLHVIQEQQRQRGRGVAAAAAADAVGGAGAAQPVVPVAAAAGATNVAQQGHSEDFLRVRDCGQAWALLFSNDRPLEEARRIFDKESFDASVSCRRRSSRD